MYLQNLYSANWFHPYQFVVLEASNGPEAASLLENVPDIAIVVSDTIMPGGMGGRELALRARALRPGMPVLLITGYAANAELEDVTASDIPVLRKPFERDALEAALRGLESHEDMTL